MALSTPKTQSYVHLHKACKGFPGQKEHLIQPISVLRRQPGLIGDHIDGQPPTVGGLGAGGTRSGNFKGISSLRGRK